MPRYLFVTGRLAAPSLRTCLSGIENLEFDIIALPISVAALMDTYFVAKHLTGPVGCEKIVIPGLCGGDISLIEDKTSAVVVRGPKNLKDIPAFFGSSPLPGAYGSYHAKILAEIVDAHKMSTEEILARAGYYRNSGADIIDLGGPVHGSFAGIENAVGALKQAGFVVSVDSFHPDDVLKADKAGADFVLSVNSRNLDLARRLNAKVVVIPDSEGGLESLDRSIAQLEEWRVPYIVDPVLKPISFGFAESIGHFIRVRRKYPTAEMMMGLGNITELTDADTTGMTAVMAGIVAELRIEYVLTTEVISWARGAVRELDIARRLMDYAQKNSVLPKHLSESLITVKDPPFEIFSEQELRDMQSKISDHHFRIFTDHENIYVFNNRQFVKGTDVVEIFGQLEVDVVSHAFYLGRELEKASLAVRLGKRYAQEEGLRWGYLSG